ncbi:cell division regulator GpsB [Vagococcus lutrae]|uniref:cell division regulator GpsB n=1 Tax=Vagococcus lutrae TaxID=81947 RepID=UPI00200D2503|nr:cell division regulator GpsB [Vagococcus lutrae]UQF12094.1 cell division regulator GpsB [Vagococcus lutrae]
MANYNYMARDILQKEFKTKMRGYDPVEVDEFLDGIIKDYETFNRELLELREENHRLVAKVDQLTKSTESLTRMRQETPKTVNTATNFDILKRLSNLEKEVFGNRLVESDDQDTLDETKQF